MMNISIKQARLSPRPFPKLQKFPTHTWENEFAIASRLGFYSIEWMFDLDEEGNNPLLSTEGRKKIIDVSLSSGIPIKSVCADYFFANPFFRVSKEERKQNIVMLKNIISYAAEIGAHSVLLPVLEDSEIRTSEERELLLDAVNQCIPTLEEYNIQLGFETEMTAPECLELLSVFNNNHIGIYYDIGNCTAKGYNVASDIKMLGKSIQNIHIKDRLVGGGSVYIGKGDADFKGAIDALRQQDFKGLMVLEAYFEDDFIKDAIQNKKYIERIIEGDVS